MRQRKCIPVILLFLSYGSVVIAQQVGIRARLDTNQIYIGDQIHYTLEINQEPGIQVQLPDIRALLPESIEIIEKEAADTTILEDGQWLIRKKYLVTSFDTGMVVFPRIPVAFNSADLSDTLYSRSNFFYVNSFPLDTTGEIRDIKAIYKAPLTFREIWPFFAGALVLAALAWLGFRYIKRRKTGTEPGLEPLPAEPAHIIALRDLDALKAEKLWQKGMVKEYYTRLTEIIRRYMEIRFRIPAMEQTSNEILRDVRRHPEQERIPADLLESLLNLADMVKFAKEKPLPEENERHINNACLFVDQTKKLEKEEKLKPELNHE